MNVLVTIPAYNEEKSIGKVISDIKHELSKTKHTYRIMVIDDGSSDETEKVAVENGALVFYHQGNFGLAETFKTEMKKAIMLKPDVIVHTDADGQYLASEIPKILRPIEEKKADLVIGSRFRGKIEHMSFVKRIGNKAFSKVISGITRLRISDAQSGFRAFTPEVAKLNITSNYTYTQEQIIRCSIEKLRVCEVPITFVRRKNGKSKLMKNPFEFAAKAWINLLRIYRDYKPLKFFGIVGGLFFMMGFLIGLYFIFLHFTTGIVGHIGLIFLMILLLTMGVQIALFGFLADMLKKR